MFIVQTTLKDLLYYNYAISFNDNLYMKHAIY